MYKECKMNVHRKSTLFEYKVECLTKVKPQPQNDNYHTDLRIARLHEIDNSAQMPTEWFRQ